MFNEELEKETVRRFSPRFEEIRKYHDELLTTITNSIQGSCVYPDMKVTHSAEELNDLPIVTHEIMARCMDEHGTERVLLHPPFKMWHTSGYTGRSKKFYYSQSDLDEMVTTWAAYAYLIGIRPEHSSWNFGGKEPMLSGTIIEEAAGRLKLKRRLFTPLACDMDFITALKRASRSPPSDVLAGTPLILYLIGRVAEDPEYIYNVVRKKVHEYYRLPKFLSDLVARGYLFRMDHANIRKMASGALIGMSYSEPLSPYLERLSEMYPSIRLYDVLGSTENPIIAGQISQDCEGLALMLSFVLPELADPEDVLRAKKDRSFIPKGRPWWEWEKGMVGELLLTRPGECMPLIRYATGDVIEVLDPAKEFNVDLERNKVKAVLPIIKVLSRSVDILDYEAKDEMGNFLGNKIYTRHVNDVLLTHPDVRWWELYNIKGSPGRLVMLIFPEREIGHIEDFRNEMKGRLVKDIDDLFNTFRVANDLDRLDVIIADHTAYQVIQDEIDGRAREGRSLGQLKPKHIFVIDDEGEFSRSISERFGSFLNETQ